MTDAERVEGREHPAPRPHGPRWRAAAGGVLIVVIALTALAAGRVATSLTSTSAASTSPVIARVPASAVLFAEVRLDQPGDQAGNLKALLTRFPATGTGPTSSSSLSDDLNQIVSMADGAYAWSFRSDVGGWVGRAVAIALLPGTTRADRGGVLALIDVTNADAALAWIRDRAASARLPSPTITTYNGTAVTTVRTRDPATGLADASAAVLDGRTLVVGGTELVHAAIDVTSTTSLASSPRFDAARAALGGDAIAAAYIDVRGLAKTVPLGYSPTGEPGLTTGSEFLATLPDWIAFRLRVEPDAIRLDKANPPTTGGTRRVNVEDAIALKLPAGTLEVVDLHDLGLDLQAYVDLLRSTTSTQSVRDVERSLEAVGGLDAILSQMGTVDVVTIVDGDHLLSGVVAQAKDPAATGRLIEAIAAWARSAGYTVTTEQHGGVAITDIDILSSMSVADERPFIQIATRDGLFIVGYNRGFTPAVLDVDPATSLAKQPRYQRVMAMAGTPNTLSCYADLAGILAVADRMMASSGGASTSYQRDVRPWLAPLDQLACATVAGDPDRGALVITVREATP